MEKIIYLLQEHDEKIISILIISILGLILLWGVLSLFTKKKKSGGGSQGGSLAPADLDKLIEQFDAKITSSLERIAPGAVVTAAGAVGLSSAAEGEEASGEATSSVAGAVAGMDPAQRANLDLMLAEAQAEISQLKEQVVGSQGDAGQVVELQNKIADLESRLFEYEIIEEDIADLSRYKSENQRLNEELKSLKKSEAEMSAPEAPGDLSSTEGAQEDLASNDNAEAISQQNTQKSAKGVPETDESQAAVPTDGEPLPSLEEANAESTIVADENSEGSTLSEFDDVAAELQSEADALVEMSSELEGEEKEFNEDVDLDMIASEAQKLSGDS